MATTTPLAEPTPTVPGEASAELIRLLRSLEETHDSASLLASYTAHELAEAIPGHDDAGYARARVLPALIYNIEQAVAMLEGMTAGWLWLRAR